MYFIPSYKQKAFSVLNSFLRKVSIKFMNMILTTENIALYVLVNYSNYDCISTVKLALDRQFAFHPSSSKVALPIISWKVILEDSCEVLTEGCSTRDVENTYNQFFFLYLKRCEKI